MYTVVHTAPSSPIAGCEVIQELSMGLAIKSCNVAYIEPMQEAKAAFVWVPCRFLSFLVFRALYELDMCGHTYVAWKTTDNYAFITEQVLLFSSQIYECVKSYHEVFQVP